MRRSKTEITEKSQYTVHEIIELTSSAALQGPGGVGGNVISSSFIPPVIGLSVPSSECGVLPAALLSARWRY